MIIQILYKLYKYCNLIQLNWYNSNEHKHTAYKQTLGLRLFILSSNLIKLHQNIEQNISVFDTFVKKVLTMFAFDTIHCICKKKK